MVDGGITEGVEEVGGEGGGLIICFEKRKMRDETSTRRQTTGSKLLYLPYLTLLLPTKYNSFRKESLYCEEKEPKQPFFY